MRFERRCKGVAQARAIFKRGRQSSHANTWELFVDAAMREYICNKEERTCRNIFDKGLKSFGSEIQFVLKYLDFVTTTNDDINTRVIFEKVLSDDNGLSSQHALLVWNKFLEFEYSRGNLSAMHKVEKRRAMAYPDQHCHTGLAQLARRCRFHHLWPCGPAELSLLGIDQDSTGGSSGASVEVVKKNGGGGGGSTGGRGKDDRPEVRDVVFSLARFVCTNAFLHCKIFMMICTYTCVDYAFVYHAVEFIMHLPPYMLCLCTHAHTQANKQPVQEPKRPSVPLPPMPRALQELVDALPSGPLPAGLPGPNPEEMVNMLNQIMIPPRFYNPPQTMSVGANLIPGSATGGGNKNQGGRHSGGGAKRSKRDDDDTKVVPFCALLYKKSAYIYTCMKIYLYIYIYAYIYYVI